MLHFHSFGLTHSCVDSYLVVPVPLIDEGDLVVLAVQGEGVHQVVHAVLQPESIKGFLNIVYLQINWTLTSIDNRIDDSVNDEKVISNVLLFLPPMLESDIPLSIAPNLSS